MYKSLLLFLFFFVWCHSSQSQKMSVTVDYVSSPGRAGNIINYQPGTTLGWDDFNGKPVEGSEAAAITSAGFGLKLAFKKLENNSELLISVNCSFSKKDSWVKPKYKTAYILNHEQRHFDIAFIHTLIFIDRLKNAKYTAANYATVIEKIYKETAQQLVEMQNEYDGQTDHSRNEPTQIAWNAKIAKLLESIAKRE
jgi:hypothetical protein